MITRSVCFAFGFAAFIILAALAATGADAMGWVPTGFPDRIVGIIMGLTVAVFSHTVTEPWRRRRRRRRWHLRRLQLWPMRPDARVQ